MSTEVLSAPVEQPVTAGSVESLQQGVEGMELQQAQVETAPLPAVEAELHRACAEGSLDGVRQVLSNGLEALETLDMTTGCTPIVLAIRGNHYDVVRELLSAGAIVPPPGLTNDQVMLSILYPQPMYGMPPYMQPMPDFYAQGPNAGHMYGGGAPGQGQGQGQGPNGFYSMPGGPGQQYPPGPAPGHSPFTSRRDRGNSIHRERTEVAPGQPNLPPADVARMIPCRNFPNCKYGANCLFFHPNRGGFFAGAPGAPGPNGFAFDGYQQQQQQGGFPGQGPNGMYQQPQYQYTQQSPASDLNQQSLQQSQQQLPQQQPQSASQESGTVVDAPAAAEATTAPQETSQPAPAQPKPFIPRFQPVEPIFVPQPDQPTSFGASPLSPSALVGSLPSIPPAEAFFAQSAQSPPGSFPVPSFVPMDNRRQSFGQFAGMPNPNAPPAHMSGRPYGHGKKASFSGGPRPFAPRANAGNGNGNGNGMDWGKWRDGVPPPCVFFAQGKCRNGEMCKFLHIDSDGNDCRNPEAIKASAALAPPVARPPRAPRPSFGHGPAGAAFDPVQRQQQLAFLQQQRAAVQNAQSQVNASTNAASQSATNGNDSTSNAASTVSAPHTAPSSTPTPTNDSDMAASQTLVGSVSDVKEGKDIIEVEATPVIVEETTTAPTTTSAPTPAAPVANVNSTTTAPAAASTGGSATLPAKPLGALPPVGRSASQPGVQRVHANGLHSRMHNQGPFHPAARRGAAPAAAIGRFAPGMAARSASAEGQMRGPRGPAAQAGNGNANANANGPQGQGQARANGNGNANANASANANANGNANAKKSSQRIPRADEFPALGGMSGSALGESKVTSPNLGATSGRTAAQVLSEPAPVKAVAAPAAISAPVQEESKQSDEDSITMDSDNESDGVIISCNKPASTQPSVPPSGGASHVKRAAPSAPSAPLSFASIAGALAGNSSSAPAQVDAAPLAVKA